MKVEQYIESGIIECYALGLASADEMADFERWLKKYPAVRAALHRFEDQLELSALRGQIPPPADIRTKIEDKIRELPSIRPYYRESDRNYRKFEKEDEYIRVQTLDSQIKVHKYWRPAFIAIFILSKIFLILFIYYFIQYQHAQKDMQRMQEQLSKTPLSEKTIK